MQNEIKWIKTIMNVYGPLKTLEIPTQNQVNNKKIRMKSE